MDMLVLFEDMNMTESIILFYTTYWIEFQLEIASQKMVHLNVDIPRRMYSDS